MSLEFRGVTKRSGAELHISSADLKLEPGVFNVLLGPTLSGKTTLLRLMAGLEKPTTGEVWFNGTDVTGIAVQKRNVAMVYQQFINYPSMTVYENIASPLMVQRLPADQIRPRVAKVAELLKLSPMLDRAPSELSGGQQQRTALARALVKEADLVLLDEPLANLDYKLREELREELPRLFEDTGATVVYATTEPTEALMLGGYSATLHEGQISQYGPTRVVFREPTDIITARTFSDPPLNTMTVQKRGDSFLLDADTVWDASAYPVLSEGDYTLGFRPHHLKLARSDRDTLRLAGEVLVTEISGSESFVHVRSEQNTWVAQSHGIHNFNPGEKVELYLAPENCFVFDADGERMRRQ
jgi:glycerol transport system ATP-binding protein